MSLDALFEELEREVDPSIAPDMARLRRRALRRRRNRSLRRGAVIVVLFGMLGVAVLRPDGGRRLETASEGTGVGTSAIGTEPTEDRPVTSPTSSLGPEEDIRAEELLADSAWLVTSVESVGADLPVSGIEMEIRFGELGASSVSGFNGCVGFSAPAVWTATGFSLERAPLRQLRTCGSVWKDSEARHAFETLFDPESTVEVASDGFTLTLVQQDFTLVAVPIGSDAAAVATDSEQLGDVTEESLAGSSWTITSVRSRAGELQPPEFEIGIAFGLIGESTVVFVDQCSSFSVVVGWSGSSFTVEGSPSGSLETCEASGLSSLARGYATFFPRGSTVEVGSDGSTLILTTEEFTVSAVPA